MLKTCARCGAQFKVKPSHAPMRSHCSQTCYQAARREAAAPLPAKRCAHCGNEFVVRQRNRAGATLYCSRRCFQEARRARLPEHAPITCEGCGKQFTVIPSRRETARYCSDACRQKAFARGESLLMVCEVCGGSFRRKGSHALRSSASYCSRACYWSSTVLGRRAELRDLPKVAGIPLEATVLARGGWKSPADLVPEEELLAYDAVTGDLTWTKCLGVEATSERVLCLGLKNSRHQMKCGFAQPWVVRRNKSKVKGKVYGGETAVLRAHELNDNHSLVVAAPYCETASVLSPAEAELLGWLVTDGYFRRRGNHIEAVIYQSPKKFLDLVKVVAGGRPRPPHPDSGVVAVPVLKERLEPLRPWLTKDERLVACVTRLSLDAARAMYAAMYLADGSVAAGRKGDFMAARHAGVRAAFRVLALLLGYRTSESARGCYVSKRQTLKLNMCQLDVAEARGLWRVATALGTCVVQHGGFISITGAVLS